MCPELSAQNIFCEHIKGDSSEYIVGKERTATSVLYANSNVDILSPSKAEELHCDQFATKWLYSGKETTEWVCVDLYFWQDRILTVTVVRSILVRKQIYVSPTHHLYPYVSDTLYTDLLSRYWDDWEK